MRDPGYSRPFVATTERGMPMLREVEEYGRTRLVLMQEVVHLRKYPATREVVSRMDGDTLVFEFKHTPAEAWGESSWKRAVR